MSRSAKSRRTFFWEEPVFDAPSLAAASFTVREEQPDLFVAVPHLPSGLDDEAAAQAQRGLFDAFLAQHRVRNPILWFYTPMALAFAAHVPARAVIYDCMDELSAFRGASPLLRAREQELFAKAHLVFTGGHSLYQSKRSQHPRVHAFPSSVDAAHFAKARDPRVTSPADQAGIARPRVGYFGVIDERIDLELLARLADALPSSQIVLVGPVVKIDADSLPRRPNLHYLGQKTYDELPAYIAGWDVAMMPFALNESTRFISPTKTLEYLAAGKAIVSTAIRDVVTPYGDGGLVRIADRETFAGAVQEALTEWPARRDEADAFVAQTSWDDTWRRMSALVDDLVPSRPTREAQAETAMEEGSGQCSTI